MGRCRSIGVILCFDMRGVEMVGGIDFVRIDG